MFPPPFENILVLTGPTASGKTVLGIELAERLGAEIVSMDSMSLYRGMDIGTAKPGADERRRVPHHLIDVLDPWETASVAWWLDRAAACCRDIESRGKRVLFVGGTPLYLKALMHGLFDGPPADPDLRRRLIEEAEHAGRPALHERLARVDPATAARLHPNDLRRIVRALEVWERTGRPISDWQRQWPGDRGQRTEDRGQRTGGSVDQVAGVNHPETLTADSLSSVLCSLSSVLYLDLPRPELYTRINERVVRMVADGLADEARALRRLPRPISREAAQGVGYQEMFAFLDGQLPLEDTITRIQTRSRQIAKRQLTWFRSLPDCRPVTKELTFGAGGLTIK
jgi:tRNA dimethylallyltransferase